MFIKIWYNCHILGFVDPSRVDNFHMSVGPLYVICELSVHILSIFLLSCSSYYSRRVLCQLILIVSWFHRTARHVSDIFLAYFAAKLHLWHFCWWWAVSNFEGVTSVTLVLLGFFAKEVFSCCLIINMLLVILVITYKLDRRIRELQMLTLCELTGITQLLSDGGQHSAQAGLAPEDPLLHLTQQVFLCTS